MTPPTPEEPGLQLVDGVIAELLAGGESLPRRHFTISREEAARKVEAFLLADRHAYVLLIVQAARLQGATWVRFDIDSDDVRVRFDGTPFELGDLDAVYDAVLGAAETREARARRELGLALATALSMGPSFVRVLSGDGDRATLLCLSPGTPEQVQVVASTLRGTTVHVRDAASVGRIADAWRVAMGSDPHEVLLRAHCRQSPFPIYLAGVDLAREHVLTGVNESVPLSTPEATGLVGYRSGSNDPPQVAFTIGGISLGTQAPDLGGSGPGLVAIVDGPMLRKDLSQAAVLMDEAYQQVCAALLRAGDVALVRLVVGAQPRGLDAWLRQHLRAATARLRSAVARRGEPALDEHLRSSPIWPDTGGHLESLDRLAVQAQMQGLLRYVPDAWPAHRVPRSGQPLALRLQDDEVATLRRLLGVGFVRIPASGPG